MRNVWEVAVLVGVVILLAILFLPTLLKCNRDREKPMVTCEGRLFEIVKACITYQEPNGGYFPAFMQGSIEGQTNPNIPRSGQGSDCTFQPMPSLACLYPEYIDNVKIFACPSTPDRPRIAFRYYDGAKHTCFGFSIDPLLDLGVERNGPGGPQGATGPNVAPTTTGYNWTDPAWYSGAEVSGYNKCSYFYDELTSPRKMRPDQAVACDADGQTYLNSPPTKLGIHPSYPGPDWKRLKSSNHADGQNVMYFDGHVRWEETVYASADPHDNIFCPNATRGVQWDPDTDAYLWDGVNARAVENR